MDSHSRNSFQPGGGYHKDDRDADTGLGCCGCVLMGISIFILVIFFPFSLLCSLKVVQEYERAVIFRLGRVVSGGAKGPGLFFLFPCVDTFKSVDLRVFSYDIPPQEILSKDSVTVCVDAVIYARIFDATLSIVNVENAQASTRLLAATTLRNVMGTKTLSEILSDREHIAQFMRILTKDSVTVAVDAVIYARIFDATMSIINVEDAHASTKLLAATTLRNVMGTKTLSEILSDREHISHFMQSSLDEATDPWGVKVERVEIKDVRLPVQMQRAMAAEAESTREARAKVIAAEGEMKASRSLKEAADVMNESPSALQLRYLQTLNSIAAERNSTIIFPLPIDMISSFASGNRRM